MSTLNMISSSQIKLSESIENMMSKAHDTINDIHHLSYNLSGENAFYDEEHQLAVLTFEIQLRDLYVSICILLESLGFVSSLDQLKTDFLNCKRLTSLDMLPYVGEFHSEALGLLYRYYLPLSVLLGGNVSTAQNELKHNMFRSILTNTPKIIMDRGIDPKNEAEVRKAVFDILIHVFPDTVREVPISQVTKTYKPDIGVKSLGVAAEYKFATTAEEVKRSVGGLYEDMRGYSGSKDWDLFYAVIYMTDPFYTIDQIKAEFSHTKSDDNWFPILVTGRGHRERSPADSKTNVPTTGTDS